MNTTQHIFICIGIAIITLMAITLGSTLFWLVAAIALISESVMICKNSSKASVQLWDLDFRVIFLLFLSIFVFVILFLYSNEIRKEIGIRPPRSDFGGIAE